MKHTIRVLMVEDIPSDAKLAERQLRADGMNCVFHRVEAKDAFLDALVHFKPDVILLDYNLPQFNALSALAIVREKCPETPCIIVTGTISDEQAVETLKHGAVDYVLKKRLVKLAPAVRRALDEALEKANRMEAERALIESERNLKEAQRLGRIGHWEYDLKTRQISWSDMVFTLYERDPKLGPPTEEEEAKYYSPEDAGRLRNFAERAIKTGEPWEVDVSVRLPGERLMNCVSIGKPIKDARGQVIKLYGTIQDITERKRAEKALRESEERYRSLFENMLEGFAYCKMIFDDQDRPVDFVYLDVNSAFERLTGLEHVVGKRVTEVIPGIRESSSELFEIYGRVALTGTPERFEIDFTPLTRWLSISVYSMEKGYFIAVFDNITERKRAEERILNLNHMYAVLSDINQIIIKATDRDNLFREVCQIAVDIGKFNYSWIGILDQGEKTVIPFAHAGRVECPLLSHVHSLTREPDLKGPVVSAILEKKCRAENDILSNQCMEPWWEIVRACESRSLAAVPLFFKKQVFGVFVVCADEIDYFTEDEMKLLEEVGADLSFALDSLDEREQRQKSEDELIESERKYRELTESLPQPVYETDERGRITYANRTAFEQFGYSIEDFNREINISDLIISEDIERAKANFMQLIQSPDIHINEYTLHRKDGSTFPASVYSISIVDNNKVKGTRGFVIDLTERIKAETQLRQSQKMETIGQLAGGVAHDFNNILMAIMGYVSFALKALPEQSPVRDDILEVKKNTERAANLTKQLLAFSRRQRLEPKIADLNLIISDTAKMLRRLIGEHIELAIIPEQNLWKVKVDPSQIEQVIINLSVNARDAMPRGGKLLISTANAELKDTPTAEVLIPGGSYVRVTVADSGMGMDEEVKSHLFEPFFTTKAPGKGTGLGLATCYGIIKQSGGYIIAESESGKGSVFTIFLPRESEELEPAGAPAAVAELLAGSETVLLAEDETSVRRMIARALAMQGYRVLEAVNGEEALHLIDSYGIANIHLLLTDVVMPLMGGEELAARVRELRPEVKIMFMSGYTDDSLFPFRVDETRTQFIQKPIMPEELLIKIRRMLNGK